jgi:hypothetical protein
MLDPDPPLQGDELLTAVTEIEIFMLAPPTSMSGQLPHPKTP